MRKQYSTLLKIGVTLAGLALVGSQFDLAAIGATLLQAQPLWLLVAFLLINASLIVRAYRWQILLLGLGANLPFGRLVELYYVGNFFNAFLPSGLGGDVVRVAEAARDVPAGAAAGTVLVDRLTGMTALFAMALLALPFRPADFPDALFWPLLSVCLVGLVGGMAVLDGRIILLTGRWLPAPFSPYGDSFLARILQAVTACRWPRIWRALAISIVFNLMLAGWWTATAWSLDLNVTFGYALLVVPVLSIVLLLPSIGGLGVRELVAPALFAGALSLPESAIALSLLVFALERLASLLGGAVYLRATIRDRQRPRAPLPSAAHSSPDSE